MLLGPAGLSGRFLLIGLAGPGRPERQVPLTCLAGYTRGMRSHAWVDRRSLALHEAVAARLEADPSLLEVARRNLRRWREANADPVLEEWSALLDGSSLTSVLVLLRSPSEEAARLRQSSPFAGVLTPTERQAILDEYESRRA